MQKTLQRPHPLHRELSAQHYRRGALQYHGRRPHQGISAPEAIPPAESTHFAVEAVRGLGYPIENLRSKSWDEFAAPGGAGIGLCHHCLRQSRGRNVSVLAEDSRSPPIGGFRTRLGLRGQTTRSAPPLRRRRARCDGEWSCSLAFRSKLSTVLRSRRSPRNRPGTLALKE